MCKDQLFTSMMYKICDCSMFEALALGLFKSNTAQGNYEIPYRLNFSSTL